MTNFACFATTVLALMCGACASAPQSNDTSCGATQPAPNGAGSGSHSATPPGDGTDAGTGAPSSQCGVVGEGDYLAHWVSLDGLPNCGTPDDATLHLKGLPSEDASTCTTVSDDKQCTTVITCKDINGRFEMTDTHEYKLGHAPLTTFVDDDTSSTVDTLYGTTTTCRWEVTYTKK